MISNISHYDEIDSLAENLKTKILSSGTTVQCSGTAYYVSNDGNDENDGKTENSPWKTLRHVSEYDFEKGDVVYLKRGSIFRERVTLHNDGVTISAYGEGIKPRIYGSSRNYNHSSDWLNTEYYNVYCCKELFADDIGLIVFDRGAAHSFKQLTGNFGFNGTLKELTSDLQMYYCEDSHKLYLYSEKGNPAMRFCEIEVCERDAVVKLAADDITVDNLCVKYGSGHGIAGDSRKGITVQNCEIGWIGGTLQHRRADGTPVRYGNGIEVYARLNGYCIRNNYIYQAYDAAVTHQYFQDSGSDVFMENVLYENNLIEYCTYSLEYALATQTGAQQCMKNIVVRDNIMRFAGYGFGNQRPDKDTPAHIKSWDTNNSSENFVIENNIFDRSAYMVVHIAAESSDSLPLCNGNVYVQNQGGQLGRYGALPTKVCYNADTPDFFAFDKDVKLIFV